MPVETETQRSRKQPNLKDVGGSLLIFLVTLFLLNLLIFPNLNPRLPEVPYSELIEQVEAGQVERAIVTPTRIEYQLKPKPGETEPPRIFATTPVAIDE